MREQEFRARDKVVQKMNRGGLSEKNLTKGTEQGISQRGSDFSFQAHEEWEREGCMAERAGTRGRESPEHNRGGSFRQLERGGAQQGAYSTAQEMPGGNLHSAAVNNGKSEQTQKYGEYRESNRTASGSSRDERHAVQMDTVQACKSEKNRIIATQGMGTEKDFAKYPGVEAGGQCRNREATGYRGMASGSEPDTLDAQKHSTYGRPGRLQFQASREPAPETIQVQSVSADQADVGRESRLVYPEIKKDEERGNTRKTAERIQPQSVGERTATTLREQQRNKVRRDYAKFWRDDSVSGSLSSNTDIRTETEFRGRVSDSDMAGRRAETGFHGRASDSDTPVRKSEAEFRGRVSDSDMSGRRTGIGFRGRASDSDVARRMKFEEQERTDSEGQRPECQRSKSRKQASVKRKDEAASQKSAKPENHERATKSRFRKEMTDASESSGEKQENQNGDSSGRRRAKKGRLRFEPGSMPGKPEESLLKRTGGCLVHTAQTAAVRKLHQKIREVERDNTGVESAHKAEAAVERVAGRAYRTGRERLRSRPYRAMRRAEKRTLAAERDAALRKLQAEYPQLQRKTLAKWGQKQKMKRKYAAAAREASKGAGRFRKVLSATGRIARQVVEYVKKKAGGTAVGIILAGVLLFSMCGSLFTSCSSMFTGAGSSLMSACYLAEDGEISGVELRYTELETDLQLELADTEWHHPGYDEYRYNIGEIGHNPFELMGYLSAVFDDFTCGQVGPELQRLFGLQYRLTREEITETRTYLDEEGEEQEYEWRILKTVLSVRPLSEILSGSLAAGEQAERYAIYMETYGGRQYFGNPFDFSWLGSVTSSYGYRVHPIHGGSDLHRGVDIGAAWGTPIRAVLDGRVASAGEAGSYGLCLVIAGEDGYQSRYAHCSSLAVSTGQEVRKGDIVAYVGDTGDSTGAHLHLEVVHDGEYLNPVYFVENGGGGYTAGGNAAGRPQFPADPGTPMGDGTFEAVREEAERHMGRPYVWGGSSPETSFDCSGYVSWVINQSGAGSVGRQTAQGLCNLCTPVSWEDLRPGDLVFFTGTYSSLTPVSHVGIYMGGGRMAHAGDPIGYADIGNSRYWKEHFYCGGRLP